MEPNWKRIWCAPSLRKEGIPKRWSLFYPPTGRLSARYRYREARSKERYLKRDDSAKDWFIREFTGDVGRIEGVNFIVADLRDE